MDRCSVVVLIISHIHSVFRLRFLRTVFIRDHTPIHHRLQFVSPSHRCKFLSVEYVRCALCFSENRRYIFMLLIIIFAFKCKINGDLVVSSSRQIMTRVVWSWFRTRCVRPSAIRFDDQLVLACLACWESLPPSSYFLGSAYTKKPTADFGSGWLLFIKALVLRPQMSASGFFSEWYAGREGEWEVFRVSTFLMCETWVVFFFFLFQ